MLLLRSLHDGSHHRREDITKVCHLLLLLLLLLSTRTLLYRLCQLLHEWPDILHQSADSGAGFIVGGTDGRVGGTGGCSLRLCLLLLLLRLYEGLLDGRHDL